MFGWYGLIRKERILPVRDHRAAGIPYIGDALVMERKPFDIQGYYNDLLTRPAAQGDHKGEPKNVTPRTVREIHKT